MIFLNEPGIHGFLDLPPHVRHTVLHPPQGDGYVQVLSPSYPLLLGCYYSRPYC